MSSWNSILEEIVGLNRPDAFDIVRRERMKAVQEVTGRPLIVYATDFITPSPFKAQAAGNLMSISLADKDGFDEVTRNLPKDSKIDILLHTCFSRGTCFKMARAIYVRGRSAGERKG
jgi:hypothetical protein